MKVSELMELLYSVPADSEVLLGSSNGTLVQAIRCGTIKVIPTDTPQHLVPEGEWRRPINDKDKPEVERELHFIIT